MFETELAEQKERFKKEQDAQNLKFEQHRIEERFFNLLEMRKEMRDEITYKTPNGFSLKSNEAIHEIAAEFSSKINKQYKHEAEQRACMKKMYEYYGRYLRHYFDLILNTIEYIIYQKALTDDQKKIVHSTLEKYAHELTLELRRENDKAFQVLLGKGIQKVEPSAEELARLKATALKVQDKLIGQLYSKELLQAARKARDGVK